MQKLFSALTIFLLSQFCVFAQNSARITGNLQTNGNFFITDEAIGASGTPQYDYQKFGAESWLNLNYSNWGFNTAMRFDMFNNSNLLNPNGSYTAQGIGRWYVQKNIGKFDLSGGYIYDQIGSGIIYRAYEERALMIDNALKGVRIGYNINENWKIRGFTGKQKRQFEDYGTVIRGAAIEGFIKKDSANFSLAPGFGAVGRTFSQDQANQVASLIATYAPPDSVGAQYNTYAFTAYNTLTAGDFSWYVEGAYKTEDNFVNEFERKVTGGLGKLVNEDGYTIYSSLSYAKKGLGITLEGKRTKDFRFRADPLLVGVQGAVNFLPTMARQNTYRLTNRFAPATQELGEQALQVDVKYKFNKSWSAGINVSNITDLDGKDLYREIYPEITFKKGRKWQLTTGAQILKYNQAVYQFKGGYVDAITPFAEFFTKLSTKRSLRMEAQYLATEQEFGSWAFLLAEVGLAPHWLFYASDMYKVKHKNAETLPEDKTKYDGLHYPTLGIVYTTGPSRFSLAYVKQVEGINCAGGICRYEPTFSGVRVQFNSAF